MSALVFEQRTSPWLPARRVRKLLAGLARALDSLVSALAAREVPEWRMREVQGEIDHYLALIRANEPSACNIAGARPDARVAEIFNFSR